LRRVISAKAHLPSCTNSVPFFEAVTKFHPRLDKKMAKGKITKHDLSIRRVRDNWRVDARKLEQGQPSFETRAIADGQAQRMWDDWMAFTTFFQVLPG